ncbi:MAG: ABC transporter permease [Cytophagaceae bacterium]|nr:ABC transporter permease [Gemmatimonadaceae bacterium]
MDTLAQDIRYALRGLRRSPGFTVVALLTLALGIGVNSAIFSIVNAVLYRPLPVERPAELIDIYGHEATSATHGTHSYPDYLDYRQQTTTLSGVVGYSNFFAHATISRASNLVIGELVTERYFEVLGVPLAVGRSFTAEEFAAAGALPVAVISHAFWQSRFGGDRGVVGTQFRMNGRMYTIVGVAPERFSGMMPAVSAQMWIPTAMVADVEPIGNHRVTGRMAGATRLDRRGERWLWLRGRVKPGVTPDAVRAEFVTMAARLEAAHPETNAQERVALVPTSDVRINPDADGAVRPVGLVLIGAVTLVLVVACGNLANLMLARSAGRRREISLRIALGANRSRLLRQLLTESLALALGGALIAVPLSAWLSTVIARVQPPLPVDLGLRIEPDWRVLVFTLVTALVTGILIGLLPALRASRPDLVASIKDGGAWMGPRKRVELRDGLVVLQVAVSLVLVVAGALLVRSVSAAGKVNLGYDGDRLAYFANAMEMNGYDNARARAFNETARQRIAAMPQVEDVTLTSRIPLSLNNNGFSVFIDGRQTAATDRPFTMDGTYVDERYLETFGLPLVAGRGIDAADRAENRRVVVVNKTLADRFWPGEDAVGRDIRLRFGGVPWRIVGVVADYRVDTPGEQPKPYLHFPLGADALFSNFVVRTRGPAAPALGALTQVFKALDPDFVFLDTGTLRDMANVRLFPVRAGAWLIGAFGALALAVASIGLYGVIGYSVSRRVREIGVRKALGAESRQVVGMVMGEGMSLVLAGGVLGIALAAVASRALSAVLFVSAFDAVSFGLAFAVLAAVAALANGVPAWRASRVDPMVALRHD